MSRVLRYFLLTSMACSAALGQFPLSPAGSQPVKEPERTSDGALVVRLSVHPAGEPQPAMKFRLVQGMLDETPGNAALLYHRAMGRYRQSDKDAGLFTDWAMIPPSELPKEEVRQFLGRYSSFLRELKLASTRRRCDWQYPLREEGLAMLLPSLGKLRAMGALVSLQARYQIATGQADEAVETLRVGFAMARHVSEGPTLINSLVGAAIARMMIEDLQVLIQSPKAPNLYWALAVLPDPVIDLGKAINMESDWLFMSIPALKDLADGKFDPHVWEVAVRDVSNLMGDDAEPKLGARALLAAISMKLYPEGKKYLMSRGHTREQVEAMSVQEVVASYSLGEYLRLRDDLLKWFALPYWQAGPGLKKSNDAVSRAAKQGVGFPLVHLLPSLHRAYTLTTRIQARIDALTCIESIRMYAARNDGKLPTRLADLIDAPAPINPLTGKEFGYKVTGAGFELTTGVPKGVAAKESTLYIVTMTK